jgi:fructoselysine-6-P-deglycase FrlB-like protein
MNELDQFVKKGQASDYFSASRISDDLKRFMDTSSEQCKQLGAKARSTVRRLFLVGSGGSLANLQSAKYLIDRLTDIPCDVLPSYELVWRRPVGLNDRSLVILASYSGETEDTLAALRFARSAGARTIAIVRNATSTIGKEAEVGITYDSSALYEVPIVAITLFASELASREPAISEAASVLESLYHLPDALQGVFGRESARAESLAREFLYSNQMYVLGAGPLSPLAWKVAMSVLMENVRIAGSYCDACEFRHGPAEALERLRPDMMFLLGTDESREMTLRTIEFCKARGAHVLVYDAKEFGEMVHPMLTPIVMNSVTQWFVLYSAILRGIVNLDDRVFMGHSVLAAGGAKWP